LSRDINAHWASVRNARLRTIRSFITRELSDGRHWSAGGAAEARWTTDQILSLLDEPGMIRDSDRTADAVLSSGLSTAQLDYLGRAEDELAFALRQLDNASFGAGAVPSAARAVRKALDELGALKRNEERRQRNG
jgi:hypothetical protein